jgi:hypothetical protein
VILVCKSVRAGLGMEWSGLAWQLTMGLEGFRGIPGKTAGFCETCTTKG